MSKEEFLKIKTCVLKVNIHCDGCKDKVKKILQKIDGVYTLKIEAEQGKVTVSGNVDPFTLIKKLAKSGKHAEIWGSKPSNNFQNQFKNMQIDLGKSGGKNQKGGGGGNNPHPKNGGGGGGLPNLQQLQQMKGFQDLKLPQLKMPLNPTNNLNLNNKKAVKFDLSDDDDDDYLTDDEYDDLDDDEDEFDDEDYGSEDDDSEDDLRDVHHQLNKMKPAMGNGSQGPNMMMLNGTMNAQAKNGGNKKGGALPVLGKNGNGGKQGGGGNQNHGGGNQNHGGGGGAKEGGKKGGGDAKSGNNGGGGGGPNGAKKGGAQPMVNQLGNTNMPMGHGQAFQGRPAPSMTAGAGTGAPFHGGAQSPGMGGNQYQQQLAAAMMNQQRAMGNERFQPMMYARPPPAVNYAPQYPYQYQNQYQYQHQPTYPPPADPYTNFFNDENTSSCNVM